jgi:hypothetical protein
MSRYKRLVAGFDDAHMRMLEERVSMYGKKDAGAKKKEDGFIVREKPQG